MRTPLDPKVKAKRQRILKRVPQHVTVRWKPGTAEVKGYRCQVTIAKLRSNGPWRQTASEAFADAQEKLANGEAMPKRVVTIGAAHEAMVDELRDIVRPGTIRFYEQQASGVFRYIDQNLELQAITPTVLQRLVSLARQGGYSPRTVLHYRVWLNRLIRWSAKRQRRWFRGENPIEDVEWPTAEDPPADYFYEEELRAILDRIRAEDPEAYDVVLFMAYTNLRVSEVARLHESQFDMRGGFFTVRRKRGIKRKAIVAEVRAAVERLLERAGPNDGFLVERAPRKNRTDEEQRAAFVKNIFKRWAIKLGDRRFHAHALRHTAGTAVIRHGSSTLEAQRMLGHASSKTTERYVHLVEEDERRMAAQLRYLPGGSEGEAKHG
ncbi:MAG: site-specific integrase [bacterium]|nr:site-specific integrase [bacterium]